MKKPTLFITMLLFFASSCKKTWQCTCTSGASSIVINKAYKAQAANVCAAWQVQVQDTVQKASCSI